MKLRSARRHSGQSNSLLLVEDNQDVAYYLQSILQDQFRIEMARNGVEGLEKAFEQIPDIVISDVMMPEMDGFEFCSRLKKDERTSHIPVILLTAKASQQERLEGLSIGADAYLAKPFDKKELLIRVEMLMQLRKEMQHQFRKRYTHDLPDYEDAFLRKLQFTIEENMADDRFGVTELCRAMTMSRPQLYRKVKALLDISLARFIQLTRLHKARKLILTTEMNIGDIAFSTGFKDPSHFTKLYNELFKENPSDTRKAAKNQLINQTN